MVFFVDDNLFADEDYVSALCEKIAPLKKTWSVQAPMNIVYNDRMLRKMKEAGCFYVQIGFQTVNPGSLEWASIKQNKIEKYQFAVQKLHQYNMLVAGFFMFGFDQDDKQIFSGTLEVIKEMNLEDAHLYILTPYPGTKLYAKLKQENRLLAGKERSNYGWANAVFIPKLMTPRELEQGVQQMYDKVCQHLRKKNLLKVFRHVGLFFRHPYLLKLVIDGTLKEVDILKRVS